MLACRGPARFLLRAYFLSLWLWILTPVIVFALPRNLNSYARLYGPALGAIALLFGLGFGRVLGRAGKYAHVAGIVGALGVAVVGVRASEPVLKYPGREPDVARFMKQNGITQAMGLERTDVRAL